MKKLLLSISMLAFVAVVAVSSTGAFFSDTETSTGNTFSAGAIDLLIDNESYAVDFNIPGYQAPTGAFVFSPMNSWAPSDLPALFGDQTKYFFNFVDLKPGDRGEDTISIRVDDNNAYACMDVTLTEYNDNGNTEPELAVQGEVADDANNNKDGELQNYVEFAFWNDDGDNVYEQGETLFPGHPASAADMFTEEGVWTLADSTGGLLGESPLVGEKTYYVAKYWCFGDMTPVAVSQDGIGKTGTGNGDSTNGPLVRGTGFTCNGSGDHNIAQTDQMKVDVEFFAVQSRNNGQFVCNEGGSLCSENLDLMVVMDRSGSIDESEEDLMQAGASAFVDALNLTAGGPYAGLVNFNSTAVLSQVITDSEAAMLAAIAVDGTFGSTNLEAAIVTAQAELAGANDHNDVTHPDVMVIITDGNPTTSTTGGNHEANALAAATAAKAAGTTIYVVGIGADVNGAYLETIASSPAHYFAADFATLETQLVGLLQCAQ